MKMTDHMQVATIIIRESINQHLLITDDIQKLTEKTLKESPAVVVHCRFTTMAKASGAGIWVEFGGWQEVLKRLKDMPEHMGTWLHRRPDGSSGWLFGDYVSGCFFVVSGSTGPPMTDGFPAGQFLTGDTLTTSVVINPLSTVSQVCFKACISPISPPLM